MRAKVVEGAPVVVREWQAFPDTARKIRVRHKVTPERDRINRTLLNDLLGRLGLEPSRGN